MSHKEFTLSTSMSISVNSAFSSSGTFNVGQVTNGTLHLRFEPFIGSHKPQKFSRLVIENFRQDGPPHRRSVPLRWLLLLVLMVCSFRSPEMRKGGCQHEDGARFKNLPARRKMLGQVDGRHRFYLPRKLTQRERARHSAAPQF